MADGGIYARLLQRRIVFIREPITPDLAALTMAQLLYLEQENPEQEIDLHINSPGGSVGDALAVHDCLKLIRCPVSTVCLGRADGMAALLLAAGHPGQRTALTHSRISLLPLSVEGRPHLLNELYANDTGQTVEKIAADTARGLQLTAPEAVEYGLIDRVLDREPRRF